VSSALPFVPMSIESFGRLGAPALALLGDLADQAVQACGPGLSRAAFISGALRELSIAFCRGNASLFGRARTLRRVPLAGLRCAVLPGPRLRLFRPFSRPCVGWVVGVWFRFALRCVALLCSVFVRLHLALLSAGRPFFPSLSVNL
jgi:hypothetical protein